jgi:hypothetical protein
MAAPVVTALATVAAVRGIVCFGSYALGTWEAESDLDLYRNIGPSAFLFHLGRVCDAMVSVLYALNEQYDSATKRPEQALGKLAVLPERFVGRFVRLYVF